MATTLFLQLDGSQGLMRVLLFTGLSHPMLVHPIVHGEPVLTAQAFYYLEQLDAVAKVRFETLADHCTEEEVEYLVDNYLFEYSKLYPESRLSFKITEGKFWADDRRDFYIKVDQQDTEVLVLDVLNDDCVHSITAIDPADQVDLTNWDIGRNYARDVFESYQAAIEALLEKKVNAIVVPSDDRDGYIGKLRVIKPGYGLITKEQASQLSNISARFISAASTSVKLSSTKLAGVCENIPVHRIFCSKTYNPIMLSHYFSGLKELNPLKGFVGFYNVLEYYFEEAPSILGFSASTELNQLKCVIELISTEEEITEFFLKLPVCVSQIVLNDLPTSSGMVIPRVSNTSNLRQDLARWIYDIRCAVVHSKKTRRGVTVPSFEPYSQTSNSLKGVVPLIQWLAVRCIEKDFDLNSKLLPS